MALRVSWKWSKTVLAYGGSVIGQNNQILEPLSPLELLHPDGAAKHFLMVGGNCPALLSRARIADCGSADLVLLAPTAAECRTRNWLEQIVTSISRDLADDGLMYVLAPRRWRLYTTRLLHQKGLSLEAPILHLPDWTSSWCLVPLNLTMVRYALTRLVPIGLWNWALAESLLQLPGGKQVLPSLLPSVALVARRRGARPLFDWLFHLDGASHQPGSTILSIKWCHQDGTVVIHRFSPGDVVPATIAKMSLTMALAGERSSEAAIINHLGPSARQAAARIPHAVLARHKADYPILLQTTISGQLAAVLLAAKPHRLLEIVERIADWLACWNGATAATKPLGHDWLDQAILAPASLLMPFLRHGQQYLEWLPMRSALLAETVAPLVATHNNLTM
jgi:hypothetical protein